MFCSVVTASISGMEACKVVVEADVSDGMPVFNMVGYLSAEVREAQDRVRTAIRNIGFTMPVKRITVSLTPADLRKGGAGFDLPIAVCVMAACGLLPAEELDGILMAGELGLDGRIRPIRGILSMVSRASQFGCHTCIVPIENLQEASVCGGVRVLGAGALQDVFAYMTGMDETALAEGGPLDLQALLAAGESAFDVDFSDLRGQQMLRRALEVAVSGGHNLLLIGPPGAGKSLAARCVRTILPSMDLEEAIEVTRIYSIAGELAPGEGLKVVRPFRTPHHSVSAAGMAGGGIWPRPGEISLAHRGILYLDELPEYHPETLELLREPLEEGRIVISRNAGSYTFPAQFQLIASMNPCKCGYYPDRNRCRCTPNESRRYLSHISQPFLDRIDMCMDVKQASYEEISGREKSRTPSSAEVRARVEKARQIQARRFADEDFLINAQIPSRRIGTYCALGKEEEAMMEQMYESFSLTGRSYMKILRVARTIADMADEEAISADHLAEAFTYRMIDRKYWGM